MATGSSWTKPPLSDAGPPPSVSPEFPSIVVSRFDGRARPASARLSGLDVRALQSAQAREFYMTARPTESGSTAQQSRRIYRSIRDLLLREKAWICQERVFAPRADLPGLREIRRRELGLLDDGVEPTFLVAEDAPGVMPGVQVYAVGMAERPKIVSAAGVKVRVFDIQDWRWVTASALRGPLGGDGPAQVRAAFQQAQSLLGRAGGDLRSVARTWIFMDDVLSWYDQLNQARSDFFREQGLLGPGTAGWLPASTGIGVSPANRFRCAIDLLAVIGPKGSVTCHEAAGAQKSANEYGSAFARATVARTAAGTTVFISGTAAIDSSGATCYRGDMAGQIRMTLENINAVLRQLSAESGDVVQAMAYCASPEVRQEFCGRWARQVPWPWLVMIGDVCRDDLLFEVEVTACLGARRIL